MKPRYKHPYPGEQFLGQWEEYDLYYAEHDSMLIARCKDGPHDYHCEEVTYIKSQKGVYCMTSHYKYHRALAVALQMHETDPSVSPNAIPGKAAC